MRNNFGHFHFLPKMHISRDMSQKLILGGFKPLSHKKLQAKKVGSLVCCSRHHSPPLSAIKPFMDRNVFFFPNSPPLYAGAVKTQDSTEV